MLGTWWEFINWWTKLTTMLLVTNNLVIWQGLMTPNTCTSWLVGRKVGDIQEDTWGTSTLRSMFPGMDGSDGEWKSDSSLTVDSVTVDHILTCTDVEIVARGEAARRQTSRLGFSQELLQDYHQHQLMRRSLRRNSGNLLECQVGRRGTYMLVIWLPIRMVG